MPVRPNLNYKYCMIPKVLGRQSLGQKGFQIRLQRWGCANRPFYHIIVTKMTIPIRKTIEPIEQVGTYDWAINEHGEKLVSLNMERINYYLSQGVHLSTPVATLLGLAGILPQHPNAYRSAWRNRKQIYIDNEIQQLKDKLQKHEEKSS